MGRRLRGHRIAPVLSACLLSLGILAEDALSGAPNSKFEENGPEATIVVPAGDAAALVAAINTANDEVSHPGPDTIVLGGGTYTFTSPDNYWYGPNAQPAISSDITIEGNGSTLERSASATSNFRLFYVDGGLSGLAAGTLTLKNLTLRNGYAQGGMSWYGGGGLGAGGAIFNQGTLVLDSVTISGSTAYGGCIDSVNGWAEGGGGMGAPSTGIHGGGFGGPAPGSLGGRGGYAGGTGGGGGGGFSAQGEDVGGANGGAGGGASLLGGTGGYTYGYSGNPGIGQDGGGGGGGSSSAGGNGGDFGQGGTGAAATPAGGGGGGVGGGGGRSAYGAGGGGFGGGGAGNCYYCAGKGGFGGGGGSVGGAGGFGGHDGCAVMAGPGAGMGGAIFNMYGFVQASNCTISWNAANGGWSYSSICGSGSGLGGGIFNLDGGVSLTNCTVTSNTASTSASALYNLAYANTPSGGAATAATTLTTSTVTDVVNNQDTSKNPDNVASVTLVMDGTGPTNIIPNGVTNLGGASQTGSATTGCATSTYADPAGVCGGQNPCYTQLGNGLFMVCDGGTVSLSGGKYPDTLTLNRDITLALSGDIEFVGTVIQNAGHIRATPGTWTIRGDFVVNGGTFDANGGTILFAGDGSQSVGGSGIVPLSNVWVVDGSWGYWKFDEDSGSSAMDSSGSGRTGTLAGTATWSTSAAPTPFPNPGSLNLDGSGASVTVAGTPGTSAYTIAAWVRPDDSASRNMVAMTSPSGPMSQWGQQIRTSGGHLEHYLWDTSGSGQARTVTGTTTLTPGTWTHVAAVATAGGSMRLYINGISEGTPLTIGTPQGILDRMVVGPATGGGFLPFSGLVDDLRVFQRALSASDVLKLYNGGTEAWWKFDEASGATSFADATGRGHAGTCAGGACPAAGQPGVSGTALSFDGTDDSITVLWDTATTPYTLSTWVNPSDTSDRDIMVRTASAGPTVNWSEQIRTSGGRFQHYLYDGEVRAVTGSTVLVPGTWYHLAAVATPGGAMKLYVNGVSEGTPLTIGTPQGGLDRYMLGAASNGIGGFSGLMDETRIYQRALNATEVAALAIGKSPAVPLKTLTLDQSLDAGGRVTLSDATLDVGTGNQSVTVGGDWVLDGGSFDPRSGTVSFDGSGVQNLVGDMGFNNLTVGSDSILTTSSVAKVGGTLTNLGWTDETKAISTSGSKTWGLAGITTEIATQGALSSLRVQRRDQNHPFARGMTWGGKYWTITPEGGGYSVDLTLPHPGMPDPFACRYSSGRWDFGRIGFTPTTVTRDVTAFSDWAVSEGVPSPPPVGDGRSGTTAASFTKHPGVPDQIDVTYDAAHCSAQRAVVLYGTLGDYSGYAGAAQCAGGDSGTTTIDATALSNVWFNILWVNADVTGNPGYGFDGTSDIQRDWMAVPRCDTSRDHGDVPTCP